MRILLVAYEFPPSPSPQSLRWAYLSNRLACMGHDVHVLAPDISGSMEGLPDPGSAVHVHRTWPGPVRALLGWLARRRPCVVQAMSEIPRPSSFADKPQRILDLPLSAEPPRLNWKGRLLDRFQGIASYFLYPDLRAEWSRPARKELNRLLDGLKPDVVISSHEPATTLQLGLAAKRRGFRWVADLGDPVLAAYTPRRWRRRAHALEARVMREADHILVTASQAAELLCSRHASTVPLTVVTQGFDERFVGERAPAHDPDSPLELLYAGSFYSFRDPRALVEAVLAAPDVRLNIASGNVPAWLAAAANKHGSQLRLLGRVPHRRLLALQRKMDVLVNLANADPSQVPGKLYEYLGADRPVLHLLAGDESDATAELITGLRRGWATSGDREAIVAELARLADAHRKGMLVAGLDLTSARVVPWSWTASAAVLIEVMHEMPTDA